MEGMKVMSRAGQTLPGFGFFYRQKNTYITKTKLSALCSAVI